jgi:hypothetical protein
MYHRKKSHNWINYIAICVGTAGLCSALIFGYISYRDETMLLKYGECLSDQTNLALQLANKQSTFLKAEAESVANLLQCKQQLIICSMQPAEKKTYRAPKKNIRRKKH